ncbi:hypothetical protein RHGRI_003613 [Rhododendron griersonianum]|uniref:Uncharacterized protein n=1 Tax=Rhododendron griersonianum TaxID=479676 RepID=A0AAV6L899_9ERIC|nr:hypothetical protein RHGRI_003613 [Rhododendron griersonianum]
MAAPANSGESDMATEDFCSTLSPLLSPRWSQLCLTPSPPRPFLPLSNSNYSMVMQYQWSNQSMDNPLQNQQWHEEDMVDSAPYLAGDSALLQQQQQLRHNRSEASDWRPRGGIMKMNNQGFEESNMGFEEESDEMMMTWAEGMMPDDVVLLVQKILQEDMGEMVVFTVRRMNWLEQHDVDIVDQPVLEMVGQVQQLLQNRGGEWDLIPGGGVCTINGLERNDGQGLPMTTEPSVISQNKFALRVWLGDGGQWVTELRLRQRWNRLNIGTDDDHLMCEIEGNYLSSATIIGHDGRYKDEEDELITIFCDEDLEEYISSPKPLNNCSIESSYYKSDNPQSDFYEGDEKLDFLWSDSLLAANRSPFLLESLLVRGCTPEIYTPLPSISTPPKPEAS